MVCKELTYLLKGGYVPYVGNVTTPLHIFKYLSAYLRGFLPGVGGLGEVVRLIIFSLLLSKTAIIMLTLP